MFRSKAEEDINSILLTNNIAYSYEQGRIQYQWKEHKTYIPDFFLLTNGIILEVKGRFKLEDRKKHLFIREQKPWLDIRFIFTNPKAKLYKGGKLTNGGWCDKHKFKYCSLREGVPNEWINERKRKNNLHRIFEEIVQ
jgi:hypothetical protein|tara:strand:+ start:2852 stop:3265 length:414 start_codon:yes stop_codon:yes gene_type:complete